ncbi:hypothetical protein CAAN3_06S04280 [[Candida] anglica]
MLAWGICLRQYAGNGLVNRRKMAISMASSIRMIHQTASNRMINPLLPFDVLEDLENEDLEEANNKLKKEKKKLVKQKKKIQKKVDKEKEEESSEKTADELTNEDFKTKNDTIPLKKALSTKVKTLEVEKKQGETTEGNSKDGSEKLDTEVKKGAAKSGENNTDESKSEKPTSSEPVGSGSAAVSAGSASSTGKPTGNSAGNSSENSTPANSGSGSGGKPPSDDNPETPESSDKDKELERKKKEAEEQKAKEEEEEEEEEEEAEEEEEEKTSRFRESMDRFMRFCFKCLETMGITFSSVAILGVAGVVYHKYYAVHVLDKIDQAFDVGDPAFQLVVNKRTNKHTEGDATDDKYDISQFWAQRPQQQLLDDIIAGNIVGRYFLVIGEKGTGKTSLLLEAMKKINGYNVAIFDAHADPEIFRLRLGKALNFAYSEDYIGSLFSIRGPRDTTALLDIERAFGKLEELAMKRIQKNKGRPLVLIINNSHLIKENEDGAKLIELLQQKAESLSGAGLATIIFNSDDYWVYEKLKKLGTRLEVINVRDFGRHEAVKALKFTREKFFPSYKHPEYKLEDQLCHQIYDLIGGRPQHISQVARHKDILKACHEIIDREKTWFLNQCGLLGMDMDDDVMESGKFSTSAMLLMKEFVNMDRNRFNTLLSQEHPSKKDELKDHHLPELPLWRSRQIMTRGDYIQQYDNLNIFTIDSESRVRADSVPMMRAFHEIASQPQFDDLLEETMQRVADIESLGRTRELVAKDLVLGGKYQIKKQENEKYSFTLKGGSADIQHNSGNDEENDDDDMFLEDIKRGEHKKWWRKRMLTFDQSYSPPPKNNNDIDLGRIDE